MQSLDFGALGVPIIRPDMTGAQFETRWRQAVPALHRATIFLAAPFFALALLLFGSRRVLGRHLALDDLPTREQELDHEAFEEMDRVVVDERDALLLDTLTSIHNDRCSEQINVGVVYGAGHMPAVAAGLLARLGYRARNAEWVMVFNF